MKNIILAISLLISGFIYGQLTEKPKGSTTAANGFIEYLPADYTRNPTKKLPLLLFFHGSGENGNGTTDLSKIYNTGLPDLIKNNTWTYKEKFVVLMPQHTSTNQFNLCPSAAEVKNFIDFARAQYNIDLSHVYLTGLSCGGNGLWDYIGANPTNDIVAAAVVIAANGTKASRTAACNKTLPTWAFHGDKDKISNWRNDVIANDVFNACPKPHAEATLTLYPDVAHDSWSRTYDLSAGHDIYAWMLTYKSPITLDRNSKKASITPLLYPNPVKNGIININSNYFNENPFITITITDISGKQMVLENKDSIYNNNYQLNVSHLSSGLYIYH